MLTEIWGWPDAYIQPAVKVLSIHILFCFSTKSKLNFEFVGGCGLDFYPVLV
jgi:hypothetical protein